MKFFTYDTYQDVRKNLFVYSAIVLNLVGFSAYQWILPATHRLIVNDLFAKLAKNPILSGLVEAGVGLALFTIIAFVMVEILKAHDRVYDKYVIRWRVRYDTDFIFPRLLRPFLHRLGNKFFTEAEEHLREFLERLYYPFVGDRDTKIRKNLLVRFYERITIYWLTQVNEMIISVLVGLVALYHFFLRSSDVEHRAQLLWVLLALILVFLINRLWMRSSREGVREATADEIDDILDNYKPDLEQRLRALCAEYEIPLGS